MKKKKSLGDPSNFVPDSPTQQIPGWCLQALTFDVPESHIDGADRTSDAVASEVGVVAPEVVPDVFDISRIHTDDRLAKGDDRLLRSLRERPVTGFPDALRAVVCGDAANEVSINKKRFNLLDFHLGTFCEISEPIGTL